MLQEYLKFLLPDHKMVEVQLFFHFCDNLVCRVIYNDWDFKRVASSNTGMINAGGKNQKSNQIFETEY